MKKKDGRERQTKEESRNQSSGLYGAQFISSLPPKS